MANQKHKKKDKWKHYEKLVAKIQENISPDAVVTLNDKIRGKSGTVRQVDISVRRNIGQFPVLIALDCKDYKRKIHMKDVESFAGMLEDISANKGAIVCNAGFTKTAKKRAAEKGIELLYAFDSDSVDWKMPLAYRVVCLFSQLKKYHLSISSKDVMFPEAINTFLIYNKDGTTKNRPLTQLLTLWNTGRLPTEPGEHRVTLEAEAYVETNDALAGPFQLDAVFKVERKAYHKQIPITECQGFIVAANEKLHANEFTLELGIMGDIESTWERFDGTINPAESPIFHFIKPVNLSDQP